MVAIEPASAKWQSTLARAEMDLGTVAFAEHDWPRASKHFGAARVAYEYLLSRDPNSRDQRRATAVTIAQLADAEAAMGHTDAARSAWLAALIHLERLAASNTTETRLEWAYGLRGYSVLERRSGHLTTADEAIERALRLVEGTPTTDDLPTHAYYRATVLAEIGRSRATHHRPAEAQQAWRRAAELLRDLAARVPMEPDWTEELRQVEAALAPAIHGQRLGGR
jgi:tetratricopeptide (TPR) repeat protein